MHCDEHAHQRYGWHKSQKGRTASERGYGQAWRKLRKQVMQQDGYICQVCQHSGRYTPATEVDHIVSKAQGGTDDLTNLQAVCHACHQIKTKAERYGGG
ncbi:HNH endonuclease [Moraxella haemolytica]|uniref:HNH endonuclease n=1 Tax=Moraxella haemolytica TaxID=2904119 RepID=UPI002542DC8A|nr:HNH endonuclease signature motif containing protein [Moraxella sp. ZY171148]WII94441.1 HNH endonuclease [Moraxella sp. ZY171148]